MQFWYNMYGATIGSLSVSVLVQGSSSPTKVWELSGTQGNQWKNAQVNIVSNKAYQVSSFINRLIDLINVEMWSICNSVKIWKFIRFVHRVISRVKQISHVLSHFKKIVYHSAYWIYDCHVSMVINVGQACKLFIIKDILEIYSQQCLLSVYIDTDHRRARQWVHWRHSHWWHLLWLLYSMQFDPKQCSALSVHDHHGYNTGIISHSHSL